MKKHNVIGSIAVVIFLATSLFANDVHTDYDRGANFGRYKTYSWGGVQVQDPLWVNRIETAVDEALTAKGWTRVPSGGDVSLMATEVTRNEQTLNTYYDRFGGRRFGSVGEATTTTDVYRVGTLVVDMVDAQTKKLVWQGSSSDTLSNNSEKNIKNLDKGVQKMLKNFPPGAPKK
jgi:hypothetical protein